MQEGKPLAFISKEISFYNLDKLTSKNEMMAIIRVVQRWWPYLIGQHFIIRTNHHSLKYFVDQGISVWEQHKWVAKLLGYEYDTMYQKDQENMMVDTLLCKFEEPITLQAMSSPVPSWIE